MGSRSFSLRFRAAAALVAVAVLGLLAAPPGGAQGLEKIRIGGVPTDDMTPVFWAMKTGMYQKAGLEVEYTPTSSGTAATTAVVAGALDMGKASLISVMNAHLRGLPIAIVAGGANWNSKVRFNALLTASDQPYKTGADLNGKIVGVPALNDLNSLVTMAWVDQHGGDSKTLRFVEIPNAAIEAALVEHRVDAGALQEPELTAATESGKLKVLGLPYSAIADSFMFGAFYANTDWAAKHPAAVKAFARITAEAGTYTNAHHAETVQMVADITKLPVSVIAKMARVEAATKNDPQLVQVFIDAAFKYKQIPRAFPAREMFYADTVAK